MKSMSLPHIATAFDFTREQLDALFEKTRMIETLRKGNFWDMGNPVAVFYSEKLHGKTMVLFFDQPSTRTRLSFATSMLALGGNTIFCDDALKTSSMAKGENLTDTIQYISCFPTVSVIVIRHPARDAALDASHRSRVPVISGGDGREHPTQALLDLYTIQKEIGQIDGMHIVLNGDLTARTATSLLYALRLYTDVSITLVCPPRLRTNYYDEFYYKCRRIEEQIDLVAAVKTADVVEVFRAQKETWGSESLYREKTYLDICAMTREVVESLPQNCIVLHPLPHGKELPDDLNPEFDLRFAWNRQVENGGPLRIALLDMIHSGEWQKLGKK